MKNLKLLSVLFIAFVFENCNNDDDKNAVATLAGKWKLVETSGTIAGTTDTFTPGTITWNFDESDSTFTVVNNNTDEMAQDVFDSGTYPFAVIAGPVANSICVQTIELDEMDYGCLSITPTTLEINQGYADGMIIKFIR